MLLDPRFFAVDLGWRLGFGIGALLGLVIIFFRNHVPESPRWLMTHGQREEAERVVAEIERADRGRPGAAKLARGRPVRHHQARTARSGSA